MIKEASASGRIEKDGEAEKNMCKINVLKEEVDLLFFSLQGSP